MLKFRQLMNRMWQNPIFNPYYLQNAYYPQRLVNPWLNSLPPQPLNYPIEYLPHSGSELYHSNAVGYGGGQLQNRYVTAYQDSGSSGFGNLTQAIRGVNFSNFTFGSGDGSQSELFYRRYYSTSNRRNDPLTVLGKTKNYDESLGNSQSVAYGEMEGSQFTPGNPATKRQKCNGEDTCIPKKTRKKPASGHYMKTAGAPETNEDLPISTKLGAAAGSSNHDKQAGRKQSPNLTSSGHMAQTDKDLVKKSKSPTGSGVQEHYMASSTADGMSKKAEAALRKASSFPLRRRYWNYTKYGREVGNHALKRGYLEITVASYNILAQNLMEDHTDLYWDTDPVFLDWKYRSANLLSEIEESMPDILCLQEVNEHHFEEFLWPSLKVIGYKGIFKKRTGYMQDGCLICYKTDKFELDEVKTVEYCRPGIPVLDRDNIGLILLLRTVKKKHKGHKLCVATTHLLFNPRRGDVKLAQLMTLFAEIDSLAYKGHHGKPWKPNYYPVILCGDFNSEPHSPLYKFVSHGFLNLGGLLCKEVSGQREDHYSGGRNVPLSKDFLSPKLGVTDQCQYITNYKDRMDAYEAYLQEKRKQLLIQLKEEEDKEIEDRKGSESQAEEEEKKVKDRKCSESEAEPGNEGTETEPIAGPSTEGTSLGNITEAKSPGAAGTPESKMNSTMGSTPTREESPQPSKSSVAGSEAGKEVESLDLQYTQCSGHISHKLNLHSVYRHNGRDSRMEVTTNHSRANCTVDYIFYSVAKKHMRNKHGRTSVNYVTEGKLHLLATKELPTDQDMKKYGPLPNHAISSDHLMLLAKFSLKIK